MNAKGQQKLRDKGKSQALPSTAEQGAGAEESFRLLVSDITDYAIFMLDPSGAVVSWNEGARRMTGHRAEEILCQNISRLYPSEDNMEGGLPNRLQKALAEGRVEEEGWWIRKDGTQFWAETVITALRDATGRLRGFATVARDITHRKLAQEQLRVSAMSSDRKLTKLRSIYNQAPVGLAYVNAELCYGIVNERMAEMERRSIAEIVGHTVREVTSHADELEAACRKVLETGEPVLNLELHDTPPDHPAGERWRMASFHPIRDPDICGVNIVVRDITERKLSQEEARVSRERLLLTIESAGVGTWTWDVARDEHSWDERCKAAYGIPTDRTPSYLDFRNAIHPEDRVKTHQAVSLALTEHKDYDIEHRVVWRDGSVHWLHARGRAIYDEAGKPIQMAGVVMDITDIKQTREELDRERLLLRTLLDRLPDYIYVKDTERRFVAANTATARIMGAASPEDLLGKKDEDFYPEQQSAEYRTDEEQVLRTGQPLLNKDEPHTDRNGNVRTVMTTKVPLKDWYGKTIGLVGISRDISERKEAEEKLHYQLLVTQAITHQSNDTIFILDEHGRATSANPQAEKVFGYTADEFKGQILHNLIHHHHANGREFPEASCPLARVSSHGRAVRGIETVFFRKDGSAVPVVCSCWPLEVNGKRVGAVFHAVDITERKRAEDRLRALTTAIESAANAILIADRHGNIEWVNDAFTRLTGYSSDEVIGQNPRVLKSGHQDSVFYEQLWKTVQSGHPWHGTLVNKRKDGSLYTEEMTITPVCVGGGDITHFIAIKEDVTGRENL
ncbi:MAG: PAS domain S-box protein [Verrucomicrobia bacterium]|nr:PAS domain S-box protein [Verrucomicrobiota bacterium]